MSFLNFFESFAGEGRTDAFGAPHSRREAFGRLGAGALDLAKVGLPLAGALLVPRGAFAQSSGTSAVDVLNFALLLEYLEAEYYVTGLDSDGLLSGDTRAVIAQISKHETAHVALLKGAISGAGGTPIESPAFDFTAGGAFGDVFSNEATFLAVAQAFEDTGVRAYKGQAGNLLGTDTLTVALQIHSVEARHAAEIRRIRGLQGWIQGDTGIAGVPAADAVYAGEDNVTQLGLNAVSVSGGVSQEQVTEAYDEPLTKEQVTNIASLFLAS